MKNTNNISLFKVKHNFFQNPLFPSAVITWNKLDQNTCNSESLNIFKKIPKEVKLLTRLTLGLSHLCDNKFKHSFQDYLNPICSCGKDTETSAHFLLHCSSYSNERSTF